ncbi:MAG: DUF4422 domain-containing protein [Oscillospiraceae bacterium]|nr:DUF4422 domain-containing protein [Oscillospiraceae bacterium]
MKTIVIVATHKEYPMPVDPLYLPVQAGRALHAPLAYTGDDTGENISGKNKNFCELTCLYWAWKNLDADAVGLCHYRRYLAGRGSGGEKPLGELTTGDKAFDRKTSRILTAREAEALLQKAPVLLPKKRDYYIETGYSQYVHAHHEEDLTVTRAILSARYPDYVEAFDRTLARTKGHRFNMFIMRRDLLDQYCSWLFGVLFELEARLDISAYSDYDKRVFGFVAERLLDVWLETNHIQCLELPVLHLESQHWLKKGTAFLKRKFRGRN